MINPLYAGPIVERFIVGRMRGGLLDDGSPEKALSDEWKSGPTGGKIHRFPAPDTYEYPYVVYSREGGAVSGPVGRGLPVVAGTLRYRVRALTAGFKTSEIERAGEIIVALLDGASGMLEGVFVESYRDSDLILDLPPEGDTVIQQEGAIFSFFVSG
jgi:hypothetical protein